MDDKGNKYHFVFFNNIRSAMEMNGYKGLLVIVTWPGYEYMVRNIGRELATKKGGYVQRI